MSNMPAKKRSTFYGLQVHANPGFEAWLEVGPVAGQEWNGVMLGEGIEFLKNAC